MIEIKDYHHLIPRQGWISAQGICMTVHRSCLTRPPPQGRQSSLGKGKFIKSKGGGQCDFSHFPGRKMHCSSFRQRMTNPTIVCML